MKKSWPKNIKDEFQFTLLKEDENIICKAVNSNGVSLRGNFQYPRVGYVRSPKWSPEPECGNGLHGYTIGQQKMYNHFYPSDWGSLHACRWVVIVYNVKNSVEFNNKTKIKSGRVVGQFSDELSARAAMSLLAATQVVA